MVRIAVCDDNPAQIELMQEYFGVFATELPETPEVFYFERGNELLRESQGDGFDIYILDMIMPELNGMEVARVLRERKDKGRILFLTASKDFVFDAFQVKASDYLLKPIKPEIFFEKIKQLSEEIAEERPATVLVKTDKGEVRLRVCDILTIENVNRSPCFSLTDGSTIESIAKRGKFAEIICDYLVKYHFTLCGASMAVNLAHVESFKRDTGIIYLNNGKEIFCSRQSAKAFKNALDAFRR